MHIEDYTIRRWLRDRIEEGRLRKDTLPNAEKKRVLGHLLEGELFEKFLHTRYVGQKRFSLEGGETVIPILDKIVEECPRHGVEQIVMGMAHRGRLNVLANILGKDYEFIFNEFGENYVPNSEQGDGDVKYHLGYDSIVTTSTGKKVGLSLAPNPSHLETVIRSSRARRARGSGSSTTPRSATRLCPCSSTATPRSPGRAWWRRR